jgi:apolipoprotein N-acyltransferase
MEARTTNTPTHPAGGSVAGTNVMAILALVFAFIFAPLGIVFGAVAKRQIARTGEQGAGLAKAGFWLGIVFTVLGVLWVGFVFAVAASQTSV